VKTAVKGRGKRRHNTIDGKEERKDGKEKRKDSKAVEYRGLRGKSRFHPQLN